MKPGRSPTRWRLLFLSLAAGGVAGMLVWGSAVSEWTAQTSRALARELSSPAGGVWADPTGFQGELAEACSDGEPDQARIARVMAQYEPLLHATMVADFPMTVFAAALGCIEDGSVLGDALLDALEAAARVPHRALESTRCVMLAELARLHIRSGDPIRGHQLIKAAVEVLEEAYQGDLGPPTRQEFERAGSDPRYPVAILNHVRRAWEELMEEDQSLPGFAGFMEADGLLATFPFAAADLRQALSQPPIFLSDLGAMYSGPCACD